MAAGGVCFFICPGKRQMRNGLALVVRIFFALLAVTILPVVAEAQQANVVLAGGSITSDNYSGEQFAGDGLGELILHEAVTMLVEATPKQRGESPTVRRGSLGLP